VQITLNNVALATRKKAYGEKKEKQKDEFCIAQHCTSKPLNQTVQQQEQ